MANATNLTIMQPSYLDELKVEQYGYDSGLKNFQRNILGQAGKDLALGNYKGARDTFYKSGMLDEGNKIEALLQQRIKLANDAELARMKRQADVFGDLALNTSDDEWPDVLKSMQERGYNVAPYADKNGRKIALAETGKTKSWLDVEMRKRAKLSPANNLTAQDRKAIHEYRDEIDASHSTINLLKEALALNDKAYSGLFAGERGYIASILGSEAGQATENLDNIVKNQAVLSLQSIFGAMPTEGERKLLLELQGSTNKSPEVRRDIYMRAIKYMEYKIAQNNAKVQAILSGQYYDPQFDYLGMFQKSMQNQGGKSTNDQLTLPSQAQQASPYQDYPDASLAPDGNWYVERNGQYYRITE